MGRVHVGDILGAYRVLVGRPEGKRPFERPRHKWKDNINLQEVGWESMDWIHQAPDRERWQAPVTVMMNFRVP
jgi:hypothetical protein